jgi:hypothetical protein
MAAVTHCRCCTGQRTHQDMRQLHSSYLTHQSCRHNPDINHTPGHMLSTLKEQDIAGIGVYLSPLYATQQLQCRSPSAPQLGSCTAAAPPPAATTDIPSGHSIGALKENPRPTCQNRVSTSAGQLYSRSTTCMACGSNHRLAWHAASTAHRQLGSLFDNVEAQHLSWAAVQPQHHLQQQQRQSTWSSCSTAANRLADSWHHTD